MLTYAMIPARSGSKGVPNKNIQMLGGHPLLAYAIAFSKAVGVDQVILSTDSEEYAKIGESYGALVPGLRSPENSTDAALTEAIFPELDHALPARGIAMPDIWIRLKPTSPFRCQASVRKGIEILKSDPTIDSVRIVSPADARLVTCDEDGFLKPLIPDMWPESRSVIPRNGLPEVFSPYNLDISRDRLWREDLTGYMGRRIKPIVAHAITGLDINEQDDMDIIRAIVESAPWPKVVSDHLVVPE